MEREITPLTGIKPGGHRLREELVVENRRRRILDATTELVADSGYRNLTAGAIIKRARVAKLKFYELFPSKAGAFLAVVDEAIAEAGERVEAATDAPDDSLRGRLDAGLGVLLAFCAERPQLARAVVLEGPALGPEGEGRREAAIAAFQPLLEGRLAKRTSRALPEDWREGVLSGLYWLLYEALLSGRPKRIEDLRPAMVEFALLPVLGPDAVASA